MKLTVAQIPICEDLSRNSHAILRTIDAHDGSDDEILLLPEYSLSGPLTGGRSCELAGSDRFVTHLTRITEATSSHPRLHLFLPTLYIDEEKLFSTLLYLSGGTARGRHDKTILTPQENEFLSAGQALTRFDVKGKQVASLICAESNGSELSSLLAMQGTTIVLHPSYPDMSPPTQTDSPSSDPWEMSLFDLVSVRARLRAFTEQYYYLSAVPAGMGYRSSIIAPDAQVVARPADENRAEISARLDPERFLLREHDVFRQRREVFLREIQEMRREKPAG